MATKKSILILAPLFLLGTLASCRKEAPTLAEIYVRDTAGNPVSGAEVRLFAVPTMDPPPGAVIPDKILFSDLDGYAIFDFTDEFNLGQAGFEVLNIEINSGDTLFGSGLIKIEEEKLNGQTFIIQPL